MSLDEDDSIRHFIIVQKQQAGTSNFVYSVRKPNLIESNYGI